MRASARPAIEPAIALDRLYPPGVVYSPREPYGGNPFVPEDAPVSDALTGGQLAVAGRMRVLCHRGVVRDHVLDLVRQAGFAVAADLGTFADEEQYLSLLAAQAPGTVVFQHAQPAHVVDPALCWIPRETLVALNDKSRLAELAPREAVPAREVVPAAEVAARWSELPVPVVLKVPSEHSLGAGEGVRLCRSRADLRAALGELAAATELVVEEFLDLRGNWCVQFACLGGGALRHLGTAEQLVDRDGHYWGNWITAAPPEAVVELGREIAARGAARGYRGVAGFDIALTRDGRFRVLDCNFRINGSTAGLLCREAVLEVRGPGEIMFRSVRDRRGWSSLRSALAEAVANGSVLPFAGYDPAGDPAGGAARASVLVTGRDRDAVLRVVAALTAAGLT